MISGVTVKIAGKKVTSNSKGVFLMNVLKGSTKITLSKTGYVTKL